MQQSAPWMMMLAAALFAQDCGPGDDDDDTPGDTPGEDDTPDTPGDDDTLGDDDDSSTPGASCPLTADARALLEETVDEILKDAFHVATYSDSGDRGFALQLVGVDQSYLGFMSLAFACTGPIQYDPYCEGSFSAAGTAADAFWTTRNRCSRLGCEAADVGLIDVYFTMKPYTDPDERHVFTYDTTSPHGAATFDPNPFVTYRIDLTDPMKVVVTSELDRRVDITTKAGEALGFAHTGTVAMTRSGDVVTGTLMLTFPDLIADGSTVDVEVELLPGGTSTGAVSVGASQLAGISGHDAELTWEGSCAP